MLMAARRHEKTTCCETTPRILAEIDTRITEFGKKMAELNRAAYPQGDLKAKRAVYADAMRKLVEAARTGEVRSLAQRAAQSARETAEKIENSKRKSDHGVEISQKVSVSFLEIVTKAREVDALVAEIAQASNEQSTGISQVNSSVSRIDKITQSNAAAEQSASASEELNAQASMLKSTVGDLLSVVGGSAMANAAT